MSQVPDLLQRLRHRRDVRPRVDAVEAASAAGVVVLIAQPPALDVPAPDVPALEAAADVEVTVAVPKRRYRTTYDSNGKRHRHKYGKPLARAEVMTLARIAKKGKSTSRLVQVAVATATESIDEMLAITNVRVCTNLKWQKASSAKAMKRTLEALRNRKAIFSNKKIPPDCSHDCSGWN